MEGWGTGLKTRWEAIAPLRLDDPQARPAFRGFILYLRWLANEFEQRLEADDA